MPHDDGDAMPATLTRIVTDILGNLQMIVVPDDDDELKDISFNPPGTIVADIPRAVYETMSPIHKDILGVIQPVLAKDGKVVEADIIATKITLIDAEEQAKKDAGKLVGLIYEAGDSPTPQEQQIIGVQQIKADASAQAVKDIEDDISELAASVAVPVQDAGVIIAP